MPEPELFLLFVRPLNRAGVRYVIGGSVAAIFYGEPRLTHDVDFVVFLRDADVQRLPQLFPSADFYLPPHETIVAEIQRERSGHFKIIHLDTSFKADMYLTGRDDFNAWAFRMRKQVEFKGEMISLAPPEYVIVRKLEYTAKAAPRNICAIFVRCSLSPANRLIVPPSMSGSNGSPWKTSGVWSPD